MELRHAARLGPKEAPIEIVVFSDFQCSACRRAAFELKRLHVQHPNRIKIYYKHFPRSYHPQAKNAARAAEAARIQGKFWEMHDLLFAYAGALHSDIYKELAAKIELDVARFKRDMQSPEVRARLITDRAEGDAWGLDGTPYFIVNRSVFRVSYADLAERLDGPDGFR
jgi:protein-disulfide isomerase